MRKENQNIKTQSNTFNGSKNKNKQKELLNANENCPFGSTSTREISKS
jgi:hypothetical protein